MARTAKQVPVLVLDTFRRRLDALDKELTVMRDKYDDTSDIEGSAIWYALHAAGSACSTAVTALLSARELLAAKSQR